jgi:hypothetical protein
MKEYYEKLIIETHASVKAMEAKILTLPCAENKLAIKAADIKANIVDKKIYNFKIWVLGGTLIGLLSLISVFIKYGDKIIILFKG